MTVSFSETNLLVTSYGGSLSCQRGHELYNGLIESASSQHVHEPTRGDKILDIILSTNDALMNNKTKGPEFSSSDHKIVHSDTNLEIYNENHSDDKVYVYIRER